MSVTILVYCTECDAGTLPDGLVCGECNGMGHYAVNRDPDGSCPATHVEWMPPVLPVLAPRDPPTQP